MYAKKCTSILFLRDPSCAAACHDMAVDEIGCSKYASMVLSALDTREWVMDTCRRGDTSASFAENSKHDVL